MQDAPKGNRAGFHIWLLALGYFLFYIPYSALVKALSTGVISVPGVDPGALGITTGLVFLPSVVLGTATVMPLILWAGGWTRYLDWRELGGLKVPSISRWSAVSGAAFGAIIISTTLAYTFEGVSILLALLLMRGGVLIMSPIMDITLSRPVHWYSLLGFALSMAAVAIALMFLPDYSISLFVLINLGVYLTGYMVRLHYITCYAKDVNEMHNRRYLVEEICVAMVTIITVPVVLTVLGPLQMSAALSSGWSLFTGANFPWIGLSVGAFYALLGIFGSLLYLNRRENTFVIPVNRCTSLLSGIAATLVLAGFFGAPGLVTSQLVSVLLVLGALAIMSYFDRRHMAGLDNHNPLQSVYLFVADTPSARLAAATCNKLIHEKLGIQTAVTPESRIYARSAGLNSSLQKPIEGPREGPLSSDGWGRLAVPIGSEQPGQINSYGMHRAEMVVCMTHEQRNALIEKYPWAKDKVVSLATAAELREPEIYNEDNLVEFSARIDGLIGDWFSRHGVPSMSEVRS